MDLPTGRLNLGCMAHPIITAVALSALLLASAFAGFLNGGVADDPPRVRLPEQGEDQHFCCSDVDQDDKEGRGEDCVTIGKENIATCNAVLYYPGLWTKKAGDVKCQKNPKK